MIYSVFSWQDSLYHYFKGPGEAPGIRPKPRVKVNAPHGNGVQPEALLPILPPSAKYFGKGEMPQGRIAIPASESAPLSMFGTGKDNPLYHSPWLTLGLWAGGLMVSWKLVQWGAPQLGDNLYK